MEARELKRTILALLALVGALYIVYRVLCQARLQYQERQACL
jgi:hypothetical protein